jgi:hypothetical protein
LGASVTSTPARKPKCSARSGPKRRRAFRAYHPADPIDDFVVSAFFEALSPLELDL